MYSKLLLSGLLALVFCCHAFGQSNIRAIDFRNFTYDVLCISDTSQKITVKDGEFYEEKQEDGWVDRFYFKVFDVAFGDLTGDGKDEAVILTVCNTGGTGNFSEGLIYSMQGGKPVVIANIPGGDRAYGGLRTAAVEKGILVVESNDVGENGGACCPEFVVTDRYKLSAGKLVQQGRSSRRELYPKERVTFPKGSTGKTFKVTLPAYEIKRFVVGARAGQVLMVSVDTEKASLRLLEDARVTEGINNFAAKLPASGDYTIEVQNISDAELSVTLNIKVP